MQETQALRLRQRMRAEQQELGDQVRALLARHGLPQRRRRGLRGARRRGQLHRRSGASSPARSSSAQGLQTAAGVPLQCDEAADFKTFRIGLFGLDKLQHIDRTVQHLDAALQRIEKAR